MSERITKTFLHDSAHSVVVPGSRVVRSAEVAHVGGRPLMHQDVPTVELVTEDDIVRAIDVTCSCGKKVRLWCSYESDSDHGTPTVTP